jgi:hypothetical protein
MLADSAKSRRSRRRLAAQCLVATSMSLPDGRHWSSLCESSIAADVSKSLYDVLDEPVC